MIESIQAGKPLILNKTNAIFPNFNSKFEYQISNQSDDLNDKYFVGELRVGSKELSKSPTFLEQLHVSER